MSAPVFLGPLHPRHGIHEPTTGTPARVRGSVRRTVTTDMLRPVGIDGPLVLAGRARDLRTERDGTPVELGRATLAATVDFTGGWELNALSTDPAYPELDGLVGTSAGSGFRAKVLDAVPALGEDGALLYQLLDDVPVTTLVSGQAYGAAKQAEGGHRPRGTSQHVHGRDMCAGFADGGTIMAGFDATGRAPIVTGPAAPPLTGDDPWAWHDVPPLPPHAMRRSRLMDVDPGRERVDVFYRDSYVRPDGLETVIHEYTVVLDFDAAEGVVRSCEATPRALPWVECPAAAASVTRLAGVALAGLRGHIRRTFTGTSTCTHLNDTLRALADVPDLLRLAS
ncbi:DUF2889 domain-containing protein [Amycolatopsis acidiphila]|uniref:DUF2889 domain-containing protein n=1 Tax=Amycolatopsis acidiphila TaxID=715473 RepID=UPI00198C2B36|nr:DUF2889 domain-containing protein [Amycolatopsis acidiphila]UIJ63097.1 DUF2889 domain-containing protein [Amycolatopsis acidiphila]GHG66113.1 hypothetical protein GCM10017788_24140 [Amycolatopsis acidiphila]